MREERELGIKQMAGRSISGHFFARAGYRMTGHAVPMGEAAGRAAEIAAKSGRLPREVEYSELKLKRSS